MSNTISRVTLEPKYHGRVTRGNQITLESKYHSSALGTQVVRTRLNSPTHPPSSCTMFTKFFFEYLCHHPCSWKNPSVIHPVRGKGVFAQPLLVEKSPPVIPCSRKKLFLILFAITLARGKMTPRHGPCSREILLLILFAITLARGKMPSVMDRSRKDFVFNLFAITPAHGKIPSHHGPCSRNNLFFSFFARIHALGKIPPRLDPLRRHICF